MLVIVGGSLTDVNGNLTVNCTENYYASAEYNNGYTGDYIVTFAPDTFSTAPFVVVTPMQGSESTNNYVATLRGSNAVSNQFRVQIADLNNQSINSNFNFVAIGMK